MTSITTARLSGIRMSDVGPAIAVVSSTNDVTSRIVGTCRHRPGRRGATRCEHLHVGEPQHPPAAGELQRDVDSGHQQHDQQEQEEPGVLEARERHRAQQGQLHSSMMHKSGRWGSTRAPLRRIITSHDRKTKEVVGSAVHRRAGGGRAGLGRFRTGRRLRSRRRPGCAGARTGVRAINGTRAGAASSDWDWNHCHDWQGPGGPYGPAGWGPWGPPPGWAPPQPSAPPWAPGANLMWNPTANGWGLWNNGVWTPI